MSEIINLNKQRKAKKRVDEAKTAAENRVKFGRSKGQLQHEKLNAELTSRRFDGHKKEKDPE